MIIQKDGRARSYRTEEEDLELIREEIAGLRPDERAALEVLLREMRGEEDNPRLFKAMSAAEFKWEPVDMQTFVKDPYYLGNTCDTIYPRLMEDLEELFNPGKSYNECIFTGSIGLDSIIVEADGGLPTLGERLGVSKDVSVVLDSGIEQSTTEPAHHSGVKKVLRLRLANGARLDLTPEHEVRVFSDGEYRWCAAQELLPGDFVIVPRRLRTIPSSDLSADAAKLLAYWTGDGHAEEYRARFADGNPRTSEEVVVLMERLGFAGKRYKLPSECWEVHSLRTKTSGFFKWLVGHQAHLKSKDVIVPDAVCRSSDEVVAAFLNRLWACEGCVYASAENKSPPRFTLGMTSERYVRQVQLLLLRFGVRARIYEITTTRKGTVTNTWLLTVSGRDQLQLFLDEIGDILGKEEACARMREYCANILGNTNVDVVPLRWGELSDLMTSSGMTRPAGNEWWRLAVNRDRHLSRAMFDRWLAMYGGTPVGKRLAALFPSDVGFERVKSVEELPVHVPVGDIGAHNGNRFLANGISVHNSIGFGKTFVSSIGLCRILYELSCMRDPHRSYGLAPGSNISIVCLSVNEVLATKVVFENVATKIEASPYFKENFKFERTKKELRFPGHIWVAARASNDSSVLGLNVISGFIDECLAPDSLVLLADGTERRVADLNGSGVARIVSFDFVAGVAVEADLHVWPSTRQVCYEIVLSCGTVLRASWNHPVAVLVGGVIDLVLVTDIDVGDEVVVFGRDSSGVASDVGAPGDSAAFLRGATLGVRGFGRTLSTARVEAKRYSGEQLTYSVHVPKYELLVADGALVHNTNFMPATGKKIDPRFKHYDHAETLYNGIKRRMQSRFRDSGKLPGMVFVVSSKATQDDFTQRRVDASRDDPEVFVRDYALWDVKQYRGDRFHVLCGNDQVHSRIIGSDTELVRFQKNLPEGCTLIDVPEDFRTDFEADLEGSIRDIAGISTVAVSPFIQRREKIISAATAEFEHPFTRDIYVQGMGGEFRWEEMVHTVQVRSATGGYEQRTEPIRNPRSPRHIHIDPALRNDAAGLCMAHLVGFKDIVRRNDKGNKYIERAPLILVDVLLRIEAPHDGEIDFAGLRHMVHDFAMHGYSIACVSFDSWQSVDAVQQLKRQGFNAMIHSVDKTVEPYNTLKTALYEDRIQYYRYPTLLRELRELQLGWRSRDAAGRPRPKVDHPPGKRKSKDVADALAACCFTLSQQQSALPLPILPGISSHTDPWMAEQHHAVAAGRMGAAVNSVVGSSVSSRGGYGYNILPPIMTSSGMDGWGGDDGDDGGWFPL